MRRKYGPMRGKTAPAKPPEEFWRHFRGPDLWASQQLWQAFQQWRRSRLKEEYALFAVEYLAGRNAAMKEMAALENPFVNGMKGRRYGIVFRLPPAIARFRILGLEAAGLDCRINQKTGECAINGLPARAGDFSISIIWTWHGWRKGMPPGKTVFSLLVNSDPAELWRDLPSDQAGEYARPDMESQALDCGDTRLLAASRRGRSHAHAGLYRDDAFGLACAAGWIILTVADGAGSAAYARKGAAIACETAVNACSRLLSEARDLEKLLAECGDPDPAAEKLAAIRKHAYGVLPRAAFAANKAVREEAGANGRQAREYATTLLICAARRFSCGWAILSFQIGDGAMAVIDDCGARLLASPDEGEFGGQTRFVTMNEVFEPHGLMRRLGFVVSPAPKALVLMTDGVSDARFPGSAALNDAGLWLKLLDELMPRPETQNPEKALLEWLAFWSRGNHDDRTIAMALFAGA